MKTYKRFNYECKLIKVPFNNLRFILGALILLILFSSCVRKKVSQPLENKWTIGKPIVSYYAGPGHSYPMTDESARQLAEGGWNLVFCNESELDIIHKYGLRANLCVRTGELNPNNSDDEEIMIRLDELINRVKDHPAMYSYWIIDEPCATLFPQIGKLVARIRDRDPMHCAWINLFPTYARRTHLGTEGDTITAYKEYLRQFREKVKPSLLSYDNYPFFVGRDGHHYFLNLAMIREEAIKSEVPFLNIIQACSWAPSVRVPNPNELRYLTWTSLAYGAQGIAHYVYHYPVGHIGMMVDHDGNPTELYYAAQIYNREFERTGKQLLPYSSLGAYHIGNIPWGGEELPDNAPFQIVSPGKKSYLLGYFGTKNKASHVVVVNLDYKQASDIVLSGPRRMQVYDSGNDLWSEETGESVKLSLLPGEGVLVRIH